MVRRTFARVALVAVIVSGSLLPSVALSSSGAAAYPLVDLTLWTIEGVVQDPVGRPLQYAAVTDGGQTVFTDVDGYYRLDQEAVRGYSVAVSKGGFNSAWRLVYPWDPMLYGPTDFTLTYKVYLFMEPDTVSSDTDTTIEIAAETVAAQSTTCIEWTDEESGTVVPLTLDESHSGDRNRWSGSFVSPAGRSEGEYPWRLTVTECSDGTLLIKEAVHGRYVVDNGE